MAIDYQTSGTFVLYDGAGIGSSVTAYRVRMKLGHELLNFSEAAYLPRRDNDLLASTEILQY